MRGREGCAMMVEGPLLEEEDCDVEERRRGSFRSSILNGPLGSRTNCGHIILFGVERWLLL